MRLKALFLFFLILVMPAAYTWGQRLANYNKIDRWAAAQKLADTSLIELTQHLIKPANDDFEKVRAIFQFVIHFLDYDRTTSSNLQDRINQGIYDVLQRRSGICLDYAQLLCKMAEIADVECWVVSGFSKDLGRPRPVNAEPDHAWNMVRIDTGYYLLDPTWASNTLGAKDEFEIVYGADYFLTEPNLFVKNHFPGLAMFQLLACPITFAEFVEYKSAKDFEDCNFRYQDSIHYFNQLSSYDQKIKEQRSVYQYLTNSQNQSAWAHALLDKAVDLKEQADLYYQKNQFNLAILQYQNAVDLFNLASQNTTLYRWQMEARGFCHLNYSQVLYKSQKNNGRLDAVITQLHEAKRHLLALDSSSLMVNQALQQIEANLVLFK